MSPTEVVQHLLQGIGAGRWSELAEAYAPDVVVEHPMLAPAVGRIDGREAVREHFARAAQLPLHLQPVDVTIHATADPEVVVAEFSYHARNTDTGHELTTGNVQIMRVRAGLIVSSRDYHDHLRLAAVMGGAGRLAAAVDAQLGQSGA